MIARALAVLLLVVGAHLGPLAVMPTRPAAAACPIAPRQEPHRGPSRDRSLPGKARLRARRAHS